MKLKFCMWLYINTSNKCIQSFQVGAVTYAWVYPELFQIVYQLHLQNEMSYEVGFWHVIMDP